MSKAELPFVVGVLADLSGHPLPDASVQGERKAGTIDRDNFNDVLASSVPGLHFECRINSTLAMASWPSSLSFKRIEDFEPAGVAARITSLRELLEIRHDLTRLLSLMEGNDKVEQLLTDLLTDVNKAHAMAQAMSAQGSES